MSLPRSDLLEVREGPRDQGARVGYRSCSGAPLAVTARRPAVLAAMLLSSVASATPCAEESGVSPLADLAQAIASLPAACTGYGPSRVAGLVEDPRLREISGIAVSRRRPGVLWVHEDSDTSTSVTAIDAEGRTLGAIHLQGVRNVDWEDIAAGPCGADLPGNCLWIGDIGQNNGTRDPVTLLRVPEPVLPRERPFSIALSPDVFEVRYPDGSHDAESLGVLPDGRPLILTKEIHSGRTSAYLFPAPASAAQSRVTLDLAASLDAGAGARGEPGRATAADVSADGSRLLVRTYGVLTEIALDTSNPRALATAAPRQIEAVQGYGFESAAYDPWNGGIWQIAEESRTLWFTPCDRDVP